MFYKISLIIAGDDNSKLCNILVYLIQARPIGDTTKKHDTIGYVVLSNYVSNIE